MTRRELLASALAASIARGDAGSKVSHLSAINDEIGLTRPETIAFAKQYGIQWLEMRSAQIPKKLQYCETLPESELREMSKQLADNGLRVSVLDTSVLKFPLPGTVAVKREDFYDRYFAKLGLSQEALFRGRLDMLKRTLAAAHALGANNVRIFAFWRVAEPAKVFPRIAEHLAELAEIAQVGNFKLLIENEASQNAGTSAETAKLLKLLPSNVGINWDSLNGLGLGEKPFPDGYNALHNDRVWSVHIKGKSLLDYPEHQDWLAIFSALERDGYLGHLELETHIFGDQQVASSHASMKEILRLLSARQSA